MLYTEGNCQAMDRFADEFGLQLKPNKRDIQHVSSQGAHQINTFVGQSRKNPYQEVRIRNTQFFLFKNASQFNISFILA